ncbi:hypothetical protein Bbelb_152540, partial [Branchiostoma belcheri]
MSVAMTFLYLHKQPRGHGAFTGIGQKQGGTDDSKRAEISGSVALPHVHGSPMPADILPPPGSSCGSKPGADVRSHGHAAGLEVGNIRTRQVQGLRRSYVRRTRLTALETRRPRISLDCVVRTHVYSRHVFDVQVCSRVVKNPSGCRDRCQRLRQARARLRHYYKRDASWVGKWDSSGVETGQCRVGQVQCLDSVKGTVPPDTAFPRFQPRTR